MIVTKKRDAKINKFQHCKVQRMSKMLKSMTLTQCDPDKMSYDPDVVVNDMDNKNLMQRLSVGVYMYDSVASIASQKKIDDAKDDKSSVDNSDDSDKSE